MNAGVLTVIAGLPIASGTLYQTTRLSARIARLQICVHVASLCIVA